MGSQPKFEGTPLLATEIANGAGYYLGELFLVAAARQAVGKQTESERRELLLEKVRQTIGTAGRSIVFALLYPPDEKGTTPVAEVVSVTDDDHLVVRYSDGIRAELSDQDPVLLFAQPEAE